MLGPRKWNGRRMIEGKETFLFRRKMKNKQGILSEKENDCLKKGQLRNSKDEKDSIVLEKDNH